MKKEIKKLFFPKDKPIKKSKTISIAADFSLNPFGRTREQGHRSGEVFREDLLIPAIKKAYLKRKTLVLNFDNLCSVSHSFLDEVFSNLSSNPNLSLSEVSCLKLDAKTPPGEIYVKIAKKSLFGEVCTKPQRNLSF